MARELLGKLLVRRWRNELLIGKIVEVEAYLGERDPASHAYRGRTKRNEVMFLEGGHLYVYFTYGMHFCANVVTEEQGVGRAILIRGVEPIEGIGTMMNNRGMKKGGKGEPVKRRSDEMDKWINEKMNQLSNGPAKFCQAFGIGRAQNGTDLLGDEIFVAKDGRSSDIRIGISERIGITSAADKKWRFFVRGSGYVSRKESHT